MKLKLLSLLAVAAMLVLQSCQKEKELAKLPGTQTDNKRDHAVFAFANSLKNYMVLQRNRTDRIWGTGNTGNQITVKIVNTSNNTTITASPVTVDGSGNWLANLNIGNASANSHTITATNNTTGATINITNVVLGDVWLCSGQSNMVMPMNRIDDPATVFGGFYGVENYSAEIAAANYPNIRYLTVANVASGSTNNDIGSSGDWKQVTPSNAGAMSAVAYYFARKVYQGLSNNVPVGIMVAAVGNTGAEEWVPQSVLTGMAGNPNITTNYNGLATKCRWFNGMIYPLRNMSIKGFNWYQGEFNVGQPTFDYLTLITGLIGNWRSTFNGGSNHPFYLVQIAPCNYSPPIAAARIRDAQNIVRGWGTAAAPIELASTMDKGEIFNIHPIAKKQPGERLGAAALNKTYGLTGNVFMGPRYASFTQSGNFVTIQFNNASTLTAYNLDGSTGSPKTGSWYVAGTDHLYWKVKSVAILAGGKIKLENPYLFMTIKDIRYCFDENVYDSIKNQDGLPMEPFTVSIP